MSLITKTNMIRELTSFQDDWCIKVRIIRLWKLMAFKNPSETWKIEMVLQDEEGNKIGAAVKESFCPKFEKALEEGKCVYISTFGVGDSEGIPSIVDNKNKINFYKFTNVTPCDTYTGPVHGFRFKSFHTLLQEEDQSNVSYDLIGDLISCGNIDHVKVDGNQRPFIRLELEDLTGNKLRNITLWGDYAHQLNNALGDRQNLGHVVIILQFVKHTIYRHKPAISSMFGATKVFINDDIPKVRNFKQQLIENRGNAEDDHSVTHLTTFSSYSIKHDFLNNLPKVCINDIRDIGKVMSCVVVATVKKIEREYDWWYLACVKCNHAAKQQEVKEKDEYGVVVKKRLVFKCTNKRECGQFTDVEYKYKIPLRVMDSTGSVSLTLFDRQAHPILDKSAAELLQEVRKKGDMDILPTDFNKLIENTYAFKVEITEFNIEKDKHTYGISQLTKDTDIIQELIRKESHDQEIQSNSQSVPLELMSQPGSSFMSPPSGNKNSMDVVSVTGDNISTRDDEKSTATSPGKLKMLNVIDVDNDPVFSSTKKKLLSPKKEKEDE